MNHNEKHASTSIALLPLPRLVLHADCTTCSLLNSDNDDQFGVSQLALDHTDSTGHVVILNGTTDMFLEAAVGTKLETRELPSIEQVLADHAASFWVRSALRMALTRDPVDAANDAEFVVRLLDRKCREILEADVPPVI